jgi:eukaryotic-like serine/threonine-protein kinase
MGGMLTQPSVEATNVFRTLANWNALRGDWKAASQRFLALSRVNRFDDADQTENASRELVPLAPALIEAGDLENYRQLEAMLIDRLGHTSNPVAAEHVLKICLLLPPSRELLTQLEPAAAVAQRSLPDARPVAINFLQAWRCIALGLWNYRNGQYDKAIPLVTSAARATKSGTTIYACSLVVRAMAWQKLDKPANAAADLAEARSVIEAKFSTPLEFDNQGVWNDWLYARILLREATRK